MTCLSRAFSPQVVPGGEGTREASADSLFEEWELSAIAFEEFIEPGFNVLSPGFLFLGRRGDPGDG